MFFFFVFCSFEGGTFKEFDELRFELWQKTWAVPSLSAFPLVLLLVGVLGPDAKTVLVLLRFWERSPGHRAFSHIALKYPGINRDEFIRMFPEGLPVHPETQYREWRKLYRAHQDSPRVFAVQGAFRVMLDIATLNAFLRVKTNASK